MYDVGHFSTNLYYSLVVTQTLTLFRHVGILNLWRVLIFKNVQVIVVVAVVVVVVILVIIV
jgi:hypothetical protein